MHAQTDVECTQCKTEIMGLHYIQSLRQVVNGHLDTVSPGHWLFFSFSLFSPGHWSTAPQCACALPPAEQFWTGRQLLPPSAPAGQPLEQLPQQSACPPPPEGSHHHPIPAATDPFNQSINQSFMRSFNHPSIHSHSKTSLSIC